MDLGTPSLHADALRVLTGWAAPSQSQDRLRREYAAYLADHPDALWRSCRPAHLTASALLLDARSARVLLTLHSKVGRWLQLGGHCEPGDASLAGAAEREATEESGLSGLRVTGAPLRLDRHLVRCGQDGRPAQHLDVQYLILVDAGTEDCVGLPAGTRESLQLAWYPAAGLPPDTDGSVRALVAQALKAAPGPGDPAAVEAPDVDA